MNIRPAMILALLPVALVGLCGFDSCSPPLLRNPGFDIWCGERLCGWEVEVGDIARVPTWHERDYGVELIGDPVVLSQRVDLTPADATCYVFDLVADADERADLVLSIDFDDDAEPEYVHPVPAMRWQHVHYDLSTPDWFDGVRFTITKTGPGRAVLAQIRAERGEPGVDCTAPGPPSRLRPDGKNCVRAGECASGICAPISIVASLESLRVAQGICGPCEQDSDCPAGQACGVEPSPDEWLQPGCGSQGRHALGEMCLADEACATGVCCQGQCAECCPDGPGCPVGQVCARRNAVDVGESYLIFPLMCAGGQGLRAAGEACLRDDDCESGSCASEQPLQICDPGGERCGADEECPLAAWFGLGGCVALGRENGVCQ